MNQPLVQIPAPIRTARMSTPAASPAPASSSSAGPQLVIPKIGISAGTKAAQAAASQGALDTASILSNVLASQTAAMARSKELGNKEESLLLAENERKFSQAREAEAIAKQHIPTAMIDEESRAWDEIRNKRKAVSEQLLKDKSLNFMDDPIEWIMSAFREGGLVSEHNALLAEQQNIEHNINAGLIMKDNVAKAKQALIPKATVEAEQDAAMKIRINAEQLEINNQLNMLHAASQTSASIYNVLESRAGNLLQADQAANSIASEQARHMNESIKWNADKVVREAQQAQAKSMLYEKTLYTQMANVMGWDANAAAGQLAQLTSVDKNAAAAIIRFTNSGVMQEGDATLIARYMNRENLAARALSEPTAAGKAAARNLMDMSDMVRKADTDWVKSAQYVAATSKKGTTKEDLAKAEAKFMAQSLQAQVGEKALKLSPRELAAYSPDIIRKYPELQKFMNVPNGLLSEDVLMKEFAAGRKYSEAALRYAAFNKERLKAVTDNSILAQVQVAAPTSLKVSASVPAKFFGAPNPYELEVTSAPSVERYMMLNDISGTKDATSVPAGAKGYGFQEDLGITGRVRKQHELQESRDTEMAESKARDAQRSQRWAQESESMLPAHRARLLQESIEQEGRSWEARKDFFRNNSALAPKERQLYIDLLSKQQAIEEERIRQKGK